MSPPIPSRIPPLRWRAPAFLWTPVALGCAIAWPAALFASDQGMQRAVTALSTIMFVLALSTLGASWALGRAPRARRVVVLHVVTAGTIVAFGAPYLIAGAIEAWVQSGHAQAPHGFEALLATTPLTLLLGLPIAFVSGLAFSYIALAQPHARQHTDVQPFT